ncbi:Superfamily I DNA and RNA helicases [Geodermatophilus obscurus]|uniref:Superfamily I DNA and RNA helicases n=1 Tax=Geodermatophilus obscurus TaxID=1861 RepID=A0A1I5HPV7_9ACTN|nr:ATP-binding domain-containing protein [Geodermatophilus obscurus]SFO49946.1 Superfamily I DNA and RNA helicases [Geodermatophilus obscurus]
MTLEVVYGESRHRNIARGLAEALDPAIEEGTIYLGYPVLSTADERVAVDAMLVSRDHGLVAFQVADVYPQTQEQLTGLIAEQDKLYAVLESHLGRNPRLRTGRQLAFPLETVTLLSSPLTLELPVGTEGRYCSPDQAVDVVQTLPGLDTDVYAALQAALQSVTTIKPAKKRASVKEDRSRGAILREIEKGIANLDRWQKRAAIETPEGAQRIRGLAGSGKTVVLALKAAYLHAKHPDWRVVVTFQSRALYQQLLGLVTRFSFEQTNDLPDYDHLQIMHAWGSGAREGVYQVIADTIGAVRRDFNYARSTYGMDDAFQGVCRELLTLTANRQIEPIFDAVLIDEAQDLPPEFFQLIYRFTKEPKRIIWGFDELQRLSETAMPTTDELFGTTPEGDSLVTLENREGEAARDIVLPICYRNPPWTLATAHALGFGIYRPEGLVQHFDDPALWLDIGYETVRGDMTPDSAVVLQRRTDSYPEYFPQLLTPTDAVVLRTFADELAQDDWVASQIAENLKKDELDHDDILIVLPSAYTAKRRAARLARTLLQHGIDSHLVGVSSSVDEVFVRDSVAIAHIYRAKGNEAPMVYALDAQYASGHVNQLTRRNTLFTALTRSRAWIRVSGWGDGMETIAHEFNEVVAHQYRLEFRTPTSEQLATMRRLHRDRTDTEAAALRRATRGLKELLDAFESGDIELRDLPPGLRSRLQNRLLDEGVDDGREF